MKVLRPEASECIRGESLIDALLDDAVIQAYNITDDEYNKICREASTEELDDFLDPVFSSSGVTFSSRKKGLKIRNKYIDYYRNIFSN
jgi:hypothetical protein